MTSGETDPGLASLYPEGDSPDETRRVLVRHARQLELGKITSQEHWKAIKGLTATLDRTNALLELQMKEAALEKVGKQIDAVNKDHATKKMTALLGFGGAIVGALAVAFGAYMAHRTPEPGGAKPLTAEQEKAFAQYERAAHKEPAPTKEFDRLIDAGK